jgi:hypothetical protein
MTPAWTRRSEAAETLLLNPPRDTGAKSSSGGRDARSDGFTASAVLVPPRLPTVPKPCGAQPVTSTLQARLVSVEGNGCHARGR